MKSIIILGDGMADRPVAALDNRTPLEVAKIEHMDKIAREGQTGLFESVGPGLSPGSAVANMQVLGYDPNKYFSGRGVLEAASLGVDLGADDVAFRLNLISTENSRMHSHSAGHISDAEAKELLAALKEAMGSMFDETPFGIYTGISFRHLLSLEGGWADAAVECTPPHDYLGVEVETLLPKAQTSDAKAVKTAELLNRLIRFSAEVFNNHPVNTARIAAGKPAAAMVWPWSPGKRPKMETMEQLYGIRPAVISAVDLVKGLGVYAGARVIEVPGATGLWDTNFEGKAEAALKALEECDMVYVHVEAPDEAGHERNPQLKVQCIEMLDTRVVRILLDGVAGMKEEVNIGLLPDHPTLLDTGAHANDPVPFAICGPSFPPDHIDRYDEKSCKNGSLGLLKGDQFIRKVLSK